MPDPISTLALATGGAFLGKFVGPAAEHLGKLALERAQQLGQKATAMLAAVGREPQPVEPKLLVPLVQAAGLETDKALAAHWAALLANAADPAQRVAVQPGFAEVLRQLTPLDAQVLNIIYDGQPSLSKKPIKPVTVFAGEIMSLDVAPELIALSIDNLLRLRLCERLSRGMLEPNADTPLSSGYSIVPTIFGAEFLAAVTPPTL